MTPTLHRIGRVLFPALAAAMPLARAQEPQNNAGCGAIYGTTDLATATGNDGCVGCAELGGQTFVSARDPLQQGNHVLYVFGANGTLVATRLQPAVHATSKWGMRDLCTDGTNLAGGSEAGISIVTPTGALASTWNGRPIAQPIRGAALAALGVPRGLCWDGTAAGGAGRFYAVNFASAIYEFDVLGNITGTFANQGWNGSGLALDARTGNLWIDACPARGDIAEIDRSGGTWAATGRHFARAVAGSFEGGLSEAATGAGTHAPWSTAFAVVSLCQGPRDVLAVQRVDLWPGKRGSDELHLDIGVDYGPLDAAPKGFGTGDTLQLRVVDPTGAATGGPCWTIFDLPPESLTDDLTDVTLLGFCQGFAPELRVHTPLSLAQPAPFGYLVGAAIGTTVSLPIGSIPIPSGLLVRAQAISFDATAPHVMVATNEVHWLGAGPQQGVVVEAVGPSSASPQPARGFWRIQHNGGHPAIRSVTLDWQSSSEAGQQSTVFDVDEVLDGSSHGAGNATGPGCHGTYRNGSAAATGLDFAFAGNYRAACALAGQSAGFAIDAGTARAARSLTYRFAGGQFVAGRALEFDCDTDGGLGEAGAAMRGLCVHIEFVDNSAVTGMLAVDPQQPLRAAVRL